MHDCSLVPHSFLRDRSVLRSHGKAFAQASGCSVRIVEIGAQAIDDAPIGTKSIPDGTILS